MVVVALVALVCEAESVAVALVALVCEAESVEVAFDALDWVVEFAFPPKHCCHRIEGMINIREKKCVWLPVSTHLEEREVLIEE